MTAAKLVNSRHLLSAISSALTAYIANTMNPAQTVSIEYSKTCLKRPLSKRPKIAFQDQLLLNSG